MKKIPTGISALDSIIKGGLPAGSVVLLLSEIGAGGQEFIYTSAAKLLMVKNNPDTLHLVLGDECKESMLPQNIHHITLSRSKSDILDEIKNSFNQNYYDAVENSLSISDFSYQYFKRTMVPRNWTGDHNPTTIFSGNSKTDLLEELVDFLEDNSEDNMVVIDSLTDMLTNTTIDNHDLITIIKGIRRASKKWGGVVYLLLTKGVADKSTEYLIIDSVDGVFNFEWSKNHRSTIRQRYMTVEKFMSVLPHLRREKIARFSAEITDYSGYHVANYELIK